MSPGGSGTGCRICKGAARDTAHWVSLSPEVRPLILWKSPASQPTWPRVQARIAALTALKSELGRMLSDTAHALIDTFVHDNQR
jgi:hypothetical protein